MEGFAGNIQFYGKWEPHFLGCHKKLWCSLTGPGGRVCIQNLHSPGIYKGTSQARVRMQPETPAPVLQPQLALETSSCPATTPALETTAQDVSGIPAMFLSMPLLPSALQMWAVEMSSAYLVPVKTRLGSQATARIPTAASLTAAKPPALPRLTTCPGPARDPAFFRPLPSTPVPASQYPIGLWAMCPATVVQRLPCSLISSPLAVCPVAIAP